MAARSPRPDAADPARRHLVEVRRALLRLHKTLIDSERAVFERDRGSLTSGQLLRALLEDSFFAWLRPFSELLVEIDEALAEKEPMEPGRARDYLERVRLLVAVGDDAEGAGEGEYPRAVRRDPDVLMAHVELADRLRPR